MQFGVLTGILIPRAVAVSGKIDPDTSTVVDNRSCGSVACPVQTRDRRGVRKHACRALYDWMASSDGGLRAGERGSAAVRGNERSFGMKIADVRCRTHRTARHELLATGGAYSHLGCRFDCPRGHRGELFRRQAAPGRGAPAGRSQTAAAFACVVRGGPGPAARGRHVAGPRTLGVPLPGARMSLSETSAPRVVSSRSPRFDTRRTDPAVHEVHARRTASTPPPSGSPPTAPSRPGDEIICSPDERPAAPLRSPSPPQTPFYH